MFYKYFLTTKIILLLLVFVEAQDWRTFIEENVMNTDDVTNVAIIKTDGSILDSYYLQPDEAQVLGRIFANPPPASVKIDGKEYKIDYTLDDRMVGESGKTGTFVFKTPRAVVVGTYGEESNSTTAKAKLLRLVNFVRSVGY